MHAGPINVFLSHNSLDKPAVEAIQSLLETGDRPIPCWLDKDDLRSSGTWIQQLEAVVDGCEAAVIFYGANGRGPVHKYEIDLLLKRAMYAPDSFRLIPVLLPGAERDAVQGFASLHMWADFRNGLDDAAALQRLHAFILGEAPPSGPGDDPLIPKPDIEPYRGLEAFEGKHASYFFGRDDEIKELCGRLREWPFTAVIGGSGCGKSSVVRAGLKTDLAMMERPTLAQTTTIIARPGTNPIYALAEQVAASQSEQSAAERLKFVGDLDARFRSRPDALLNTLTSLFVRDDQQVLLVIDQFEELFTHATETQKERREVEAPAGPRAGDSQETSFVDLLAAVAKSQLDRLRIVISLRVDFFDRCLNVPTLKSLIENRTLLLGKLSDSALRTVIEAPAFKVGAYFEKGLMARILKDVERQNGSLPLLQHALKELWEQRRFCFLTDDAYDNTGGVEGALKKRANATLRNLSEAQREIAKNIFLRLTTLGEGVSDTRRRVLKTELYPRKSDPRIIDEVLSQLSSQANRLIVTNDDGTIEVTHEALIQRWDTLKGWLAEVRDDKRLHDRLRDAANEWSAPQNGRDPSYLWEGGRLDLAEKFAVAHSKVLNALELAFLDNSIAKREHAKTREAEEQRAKLNRQKALAEAEADRAQLAEEKARLAEENSRKAEENAQLAADKARQAEENARLADEKAAEADGRKKDADSAAEKQRRLGHKLLAVAVVAIILAGAAGAFALSYRKARETAQAEQQISQRHLRESLVHQARALRQSTVADRRQQALSALSRAAKLKIVEEDDPLLASLRSEYLRCLEVPAITLVSHYPEARHRMARGLDNRLIALTQKGPLREFDSQTGKLGKTFGGQGEVGSIAVLDPGGTQIAFRSQDGKHLTVQSLNDPGFVTTTDPEIGEIQSIAFGSDVIVTAAGTGVRDGWVISVWNSRTLARLLHWNVEALLIDSLTLAPNGETVVASVFGQNRGCMQHIVGWTLDDGAQLFKVLVEHDPHSGPTRSLNDSPQNVPHRVDFSPDGRNLAVAGFRGSVALWSDDSQNNSWKEVASIRAYDLPAEVVRFSPDGRWFATVGRFADGVRLFGSELGQVVASAKSTTPNSSPNLIWTDTTTFVISDDWAGFQLWRTITPHSHVARPHTGPSYSSSRHVESIRFSPSNRWLAVAYDDSSPGLIALREPGLKMVPLEGMERAQQMCFSPTEDAILGSALSSTLNWSLAPATFGKLTKSTNDFTRHPIAASDASEFGKIVAGVESRVHVSLKDADGKTVWSHAERGTTLFGPSPLVSPKSKLAITGHITQSGYVSLVWDLGTGTPLSRLPIDIQHPFFVGESPLALSMLQADDSALEFPLSVADLTTGKVVKTVPDKGRRHDTFRHKYVVSGDGSNCAEASFQFPEINLWDLTTGQLRAIVRRDAVPDGIDLKAFSNDGKMFAARIATGVCVWDTSRELPKELKRIDVDPVAIGFRNLTENEPSLVVVDKDKRVLAWHPGLMEAQPICQLRDQCNDPHAEFTLASDRRAIFVTSRQEQSMRVSAYDILDGSLLKQWVLPDEAKLDVSLDNKGERIVVTNTTSQLKIWQWASGKEITTLGPIIAYPHNETIRFSPDGGYLAFIDTPSPGTPSSAPQYNLRVVKVKKGGKGDFMQIAIKSNVGPIAISSEASIIACGSGNQIKAYRSGKPYDPIVLDGHDDQIVALDIDSAGSLLASASRDRTIRLWMPGKGRLLLVLDAGPACPTRVVVSPDGAWLAVGDENGSVRFWNLTETRRHLRQNGLDWD